MATCALSGWKTQNVPLGPKNNYLCQLSFHKFGFKRLMVGRNLVGKRLGQRLPFTTRPLLTDFCCVRSWGTVVLECM